MKIKNIQQYRTFYKNVLRNEPSKDENFIGNFRIDKDSGTKKLGWFSIYHGDKEGYGTPESGIENFLQSFLDMAKDGQAVYEFLQNAVDSGSSHFSMVWGMDEIDKNYYLLVANNGKMFNLANIRSILNVGSSTKNDSHTIGKFGIGFKLAHRLVGKDNGLQELINENSGPILFSWKNYEIQNLAETENLEPQDLQEIQTGIDNYEILDENPWLFKILITCFPCMPENGITEDIPKMVDGIQAATNPFSALEYEVLSRWVKNNLNILNRETYTEGSLFFIKLGSGKQEELAEENLSKGVKFAIAILKETAPEHDKDSKLLKTVQLNNDEPITYPNLDYIKLKIDKAKDMDTCAYIRFGIEDTDKLTNEQKRKIENEADIEVLFGFKKYNEIGDYFKGAPNLYLYFPLSEEVHNFNYILHSNAFYKGSSRTFLHNGNTKEDGINERLLKTIVKKVDWKLSELSISDDMQEKKLFLDFYAALLTSGKSSSQYRIWMQKPYIDPLDLLLEKYIPVKNSSNSENYTVLGDKTKVFIKKTAIDIDTRAWNLENIHWFFWEKSFPKIIDKCTEKFNITEYSVFDLLKNEGIDVFINSWMNGEEMKIRLVLHELSEFAADVSLINQIRPQLLKLKLFRFSNKELLSLSEFLEKEHLGYILIHNSLAEVKEILTKAGLITSEIDLSTYRFVEIYRTYLLQASRHKGYTELVQLFSNTVTDENLKRLSKSEKLQLFDAFRTISDNVTERIKELKLFSNNLGRPAAFKSLLMHQDSWLNTFSISPLEYDQKIKSFLLDNRKELYQNIVYPFWLEILAFTVKNKNTVKEIVSDIASLFNESSWSDKHQHLLSRNDVLVYQSKVIDSKAIFFNKAMSSLSEEAYEKIQKISFKFYGVHIPDRYLLNFMEETPLSYLSINLDPSIDNTAISLDDVNDLMLFCSSCHINFFEHNTIVYNDSSYYIDSRAELKQYSSPKADVVDYVTKYYSDQLILIPENVKTSNGQITLCDTSLALYLIDSFDRKNIIQEHDLIKIILNERNEDKKSLLESLSSINLDKSWESNNENELYLKLLNDVLINLQESEELHKIQQKIYITDGLAKVNIGIIDSAQDVIEVLRDDKIIHLSQSQILNLDIAGSIKTVQEFHDSAVGRNLIHPKTADSLFKISKTGISDQLIERFENNLKQLNLLKNALPLNNAHQLCFVLLSGSYQEDDFEKFAVHCCDDKWHFLNGIKVIGSELNKKFIAPDYLLSESYEGLQELLSLSDTEVFNYSDNEQNLLVSRFIFTRGLTPKILKEKTNLHEQLDYLYEAWKMLPSNKRESKRNENWLQILGINPNEFILNGIQCHNEILPEEFTSWCSADRSKHDFFKTLGINVNESYIEDFRHFLLAKKDSYQEHIDILKFNNTLLLNTLNGLCGDFTLLDNDAFIFLESEHSEQIEEIEKIIHHLTENKYDCPVLVYYDLNSFILAKQNDIPVCRIDELLHDKLQKCPDNNLQAIYDYFYIVKDSLLVNEDIRENALKITFNKEFQASADFETHQEPFYHNWSRQHSIILIKEDILQFRVYYQDQDEKTLIGTITDSAYFISSNEEATTINYSKNIHLEGLKTLLENDSNPLASLIGELISKRDTMLASIYNAYNSASRDDVSSEHLKALQEAFREEDLKQQRSDLLGSIKSNTKYSYLWFISYLEYLQTFSKSSSDNSRQKKIHFHSIKRQRVNNLLSNKYFLLCGASSYISDSIEDVSDFTLSVLLKNNHRFDLSVEGAQKQGQDLLIFCPKGLNKEITEHFDLIFQLEILFVPQIDLLKELKNAFSNTSNLNSWEDIAIEMPFLHFIYGPPGTGKTTTLCHKIIDEVKINPNIRYLFLTPTNKASDVLCKKLLKSSDSSDNLIASKMEELKKNDIYLSAYRIGKPTDPELEALDPEIYQDSVREEIINSANLVAMTIHRLPYTKVFSSDLDNEIKLFKLENHWDYVVFDEASMINLPYLVFSILSIRKFNPNAKFIIAGDPKQIPPVADINDRELEELDIQAQNIYSMLNINSFNENEQELRKGDKIENLKTQYRSVKKIGQLFSELSYSGLLSHERDLGGNIAKKLPVEFGNLIDNSVVFIDIPLNNEESIYKIRQLFYSSYHIYGAILISEIIKYFDQCLMADESWTIGLIAPYKAQAVLMNKLIASFGISDKLKIYADTVHGFQGDECDIVFFISNPNNYRYTNNPQSLLSKEYIYNVAVSRAKDYLIILHPFKEIQDNIFINKLKKSYTKNFGGISIQKAEQFEKVLFKDGSFIYANSYVTGHDTVNVFGQLEKKYFIKANSSAIDIQLRKL